MKASTLRRNSLVALQIKKAGGRYDPQTYKIKEYKVKGLAITAGAKI